MKKYLLVILFLNIFLGIYSQNRICFIDSMDICKDEIEEYEKYLLKLIRKHPSYRKYSNLKQLHFFNLKSKDERLFTKEEYLDYSFLNHLKFIRYTQKRSWFKKDMLFSTDTYLFTPEGEPVGHIRFGLVEPLDWLRMLNVDDLGRLVAEKKISFAFCGGSRQSIYTSEAFGIGAGELYCVIDNKIYLLENFDLMNPDYLEDRNLRLTLLEDFIEQHTITVNQKDKFYKIGHNLFQRYPQIIRKGE